MNSKARMALYVFLVGAVGITVVFLRGSGDPARRFYQRAEALLAAGDFESAAAAYGEVATRFPGSQWADHALYKQGFILSNYLGRWTEAVQALQALAQRPGSAFRDDGLLALGGIYEGALVQPDEALAVYRRLVEEYGHLPEVAAEAEVGIARCLVNKGDEAAFSTCEGILGQFSNQTDVAAEAEYLLARAHQTIRNEPEEAMRRYKGVAERYPGTSWAAKAANELGWHFYEALRKEERTRVLLELPGATGAATTPGVSPAASVFAGLLGSAGGLSAEGFAGLSGEAFRFFYFPKEPSRGAETFYRNPFVAVCEAQGLPYFYQEFKGQEQARAALKKALFQRHPVVTSLAGPPPGWAIVIGSDAGRGEIYVHDPFTKYRAYRSKEFTARWGTAPAPRVLLAGKEVAASGYPVFFLEGSAPKKNLKEAVTFAIKRALQDVRRELPGGGGFASFRAFQGLIDQLEATENRASAAFLVEMAAWNGSGSAHLIGCRKAAATFLNEIAGGFPSGARKHLRYAAEDYTREVELLRRVRELLPAGEALPAEEGGESVRGLASLGERLPKAAAVLRDALQYEHSAVSHLSEAMKGL